MLGPEGWLRRQKERKEKEKKEEADAKKNLAKPRFDGRHMKGKSEKYKSKVRRAEKDAKDGMNQSAFNGGWGRKSYFYPLIKHSASGKTANKASEELLRRPKYTGLERKSFFQGRFARHRENDMQAEKAAKEGLRKPNYLGGWERKSVFNRMMKNKHTEKKALEDAKELHRKPLYTGMDRQTEIMRQRAQQGVSITGRITERMAKKFGPAMFFNAAGAKPLKATVQETFPDEVDVCIIGAGFAGAYAAYIISQRSPRAKIAVLEKEGDCGGRLLSSDNDAGNTSNKDELGGMRLFKVEHNDVAKLVTSVGCHLEPFNDESTRNLYHVNGKSVRRSEFHINGRSPKQIVEECIEQYFLENPKDEGKDPYDCFLLASMSAVDFLTKYGASEEDINGLFSYSGYDLFNDEEVQAATFIQEQLLLGSEYSSEQSYVREGYQEVVRRMLSRSNAYTAYEANVLAIDEVVTGDREVFFSLPNGKSKTLRATHVICCIPHNALCKLLPAVSCVGEDRKATVLESIKTIPLFKAFLEWDNPYGVQQWWMMKGYRYGKSTTDMPIRQLYYYDDEDLLVYNSGAFAEEWNKKFLYDADEGMREMFEQIKTLHNDPDIPEPTWKECIYKYWENGSHKWKVDHIVPQVLPTIVDGTLDSSNIHIAGDAVSRHQGWTMGCVETVDMVLDRIRFDL